MTDQQPVRVIGGAQLRRTLRAAGRDLNDLKQANADAAAFVAAAARTGGPRRTGRLLATVRGNRAAGRARVMAGGARTPYAGPIHWGWPSRGIEPQPWIAEAAQSTETAWLAIYSRDIEKAIRQVKGA